MTEEHSTGIITAFAESVTSTSDTEPNLYTVHSTTVNVSILHTCEAREEGIECHAQATQLYTTSERITRHLCDYHFRKLLRIIVAWHACRKNTASDLEDIA